MGTPTTIHVRAETQPTERCSPVSPATVKALLAAGYCVHVEHGSARIYRDDEFKAAGAKMVPEGSWTTAPSDHIILGLKRLGRDPPALSHTHIHFGSYSERQTSSADYLCRFVDGGGTLYDIEHLTDDQGHPVASFGYWAGYAGAALALLAWSHQMLHPAATLGPLSPFRYHAAVSLVEDVMSSLSAALKTNQSPQILILGASTPSGRGATDLCSVVGVPPWSISERNIVQLSTSVLVPQMTSSDILINCAQLCPTFYPELVVDQALAEPERKLRVLCDATLDGVTPRRLHPSVVDYSKFASFRSPTITIPSHDIGHSLVLVSLDDLPNLVAREASDQLAQSLLPVLLTLDKRETERVWTRAQRKFHCVADLLLLTRCE
ncbi:saccharopine dehydrogenase [Naviculisporaceae sp. PSN 640]